MIFMPLPEFGKIVQDKTTTPVWACDMRGDEFVSYDVTYKTKIYFGLFDKYICMCPEADDMPYYVYDPVKHGADPDKKYPVLMWLHGASNALDGIKCIMCCGAEQYASPKYQQEMGGGAYLIVPLAGEKRLADGNISGSWTDDSFNYSEPLKKIFDTVCRDHKPNIGKKFVMGASSGGFMTWRLLEDYLGFFNGAIPMASGYMPSHDTLDAIVNRGTHLIVAHGKHDEMADYTSFIMPNIEKLQSLKNCICFFPDWVYNGDGGIASINYGWEMGQHCMINWIQQNLMFDNGKPADERLPRGITGWIRDICEK